MSSLSRSQVHRSWKNPGFFPHSRVAGLVMLAWGLGSAPAYAQRQYLPDGLRPYVALGYNYDDNLFRLADSNPGYDGQRGDKFHNEEVGLLFDKVYGRQAVSLSAKVSRVNFDHFRQLDYSGKNFSGDWRWHLGNHLEGAAGATYAQVLAPYTDVVTNQRNLRTTVHEFGYGVWTFHSNWKLRAGLTHDRNTYELEAQSFSNRSEDTGELGLDYQVASGSRIGVLAHKLKSRYEKLRVVNGQAIDPSSDQEDAKLHVYWSMTPVTDLDFTGGWARRNHVYFSERDSSGANARLKANTLVFSQARLSAQLWREFSGIESNVVSYSLNTGASLSASWVFDPKLQFDAQSRYEKREFKGLLAQAFALDLHDQTTQNSVGLTYVPGRKVQLGLSVYRETRHGIPLLGSGSYRSNGASINVNLQY